MAYTEFYCNSLSGSNINAGDNRPIITSTNGNWNGSTTFTAAAGAPFTGVVAGDFASIYADGATTTGYIALVTNNSNDNVLTLSTSSKSGTAPVAAGTGISCTVGGKWKGPNGAVRFPFDTVTVNLSGLAGYAPRINLQNTQPYPISATFTAVNLTGITMQGYTTTPGDLGKATLYGTATSITLFQTTAATTAGGVVADIIFRDNGTTGGTIGTIFAGRGTKIQRCVFHGMRGFGAQVGSSSHGIVFYECEAFDCNRNNGASSGGFDGGQTTTFINCISHNNPGSNNNGFVNANLINSIAESNGNCGLFTTGATPGGYIIERSDFYNNGTDGIRNAETVGASYVIRNSNFIKNGTCGVRRTGSTAAVYDIVNCGFGTGTMANTVANLSGSALTHFNVVSVGYATDADPYIDAPNGNFGLALAASKGTGRSTFTQVSGYTSTTIGYPDVGAAQTLNTSSSSSAHAYAFVS